MAFKASNLLPIFTLLLLLSFGARSAWATTLDADIADALQKKDWPTLVLLLEPRSGQNFEHDLTLAKALLSLERRQEALKLLSTWVATRRDERALKLFETAGTLFFTQEASNLYYESLELIRQVKLQEAKEHLDQALVKEPGQILLLIRLIQMQLALKQYEAANANLKIAQATTTGHEELKLFAAEAAAAKAPELTIDGEKDEAELYRTLAPIKNQLLENEVTLPLWSEALKRTNRDNELEVLSARILKDHPLWTYALMWFYQNLELKPAVKDKFRTQIDKNLKSKDAFLAVLEKEMKETQYFWVGYINYETLLAEFVAVNARPTPAPTVTPTPKPALKSEN